MTYIISAMLSTGLANHEVHCAEIEFLQFRPSSGQTCGEYMAPFMELAGGAVSNANGTSVCKYCPWVDTNAFLSSMEASYDDRWRNVGLIWAYIVFNVFATLSMYWVARVPKQNVWKGIIRIISRRQK